MQHSHELASLDGGHQGREDLFERRLLCDREVTSEPSSGKEDPTRPALERCSRQIFRFGVRGELIRHRLRWPVGPFSEMRAAMLAIHDVDQSGVSIVAVCLPLGIDAGLFRR